jgi:hypothetical protein
MREDRALGTDRAVIADHEHGVEGPIEALHHVQGLVPSGEVGGVVVQRPGCDVLHRPVGVVDEHVTSARLDGAIDRGIHFVGQELAADLVVGTWTAYLLPVDDPRDALDIG